MDYGHRYADKKISAVDRELKKTYRTAQKEMKTKLADFNKRFEKKNRELKKKLADGEITDDEYKSWLTGQVFVRSRWEEQIRMINSVLLDHNRQALNIVNTSRFDVFAENYNYNAFLAERGIVGTFNLYNAEAVARLIVDDPQILPEWNIDKAKDYKWNRQKVNNAIRQGIIQGKTVEEITADLTEGLASKNESRMRLFARTAITEAENAGRQQQMNDAAAMGIEVKKRWLATHDGRTRDAHRGLDGDTVPFDQPFHSMLGDIMHPGDPTAAPANVYNCRCTMRTIYPKYDMSTPRGEGVTVDGQSYDEWKKGKQKKGEVKQGKAENAPAVTPFVPASTRAEAEAYAREHFAKSVDYSGISLENCNTINRVLKQLTDKYPINPLETIEQKQQRAVAKASSKHLVINGKNLGKVLADEEENFKRWQELQRSLIEQIRSRYAGKAKLPWDVEQKIEKLQNELKFTRYGVNSSYADHVGVTITHEYGHILSDQYFGMINDDRANPHLATNWSLRSMKGKWKEAHEKAIETGDIYKLSLYGNRNTNEFFAECFTAYEMGEKLPDYVESLMQEVLKNGIL